MPRKKTRMNSRKKRHPARPLRIMNGIKNPPFVSMFSGLTTDCGVSRKLILTKNFHGFHQSSNILTPATVRQIDPSERPTN